MLFRDLNEAQILALAITAEEEDAHIYRDFAESLRTDFPATAELFTKMAAEEDGHRHRLTELYRQRFGEHIPLIRRQDVKGFIARRPSWFTQTLRPEHARDEEQRHEKTAEEITDAQDQSGAISQEREVARRLFVLRFVQPGLAGLMDGSVSTLAPLFAAAFATGNTLDTFKVGLAASVGAGISMGFAEAMSDDGKLSGRGTPWIRGVVCGLMTTLGGLGHTLPYLIRDFHLATTIALVVVAVELGVIAWIRKRYMDTALLSAIFQVVVGGVLVFLAGWLIGAV
jgi:rubrerythrin